MLSILAQIDKPLNNHIFTEDLQNIPIGDEMAEKDDSNDRVNDKYDEAKDLIESLQAELIKLTALMNQKNELDEYTAEDSKTAIAFNVGTPSKKEVMLEGEVLNQVIHLLYSELAEGIRVHFNESERLVGVIKKLVRK